jgi:hypothetical protein
MSGIDNTPGCIQVALDAIDHARATEGLGALVLPRTFAAMPFAQQMLTVVDTERVDRHLAPVVGSTSALDALAARGAQADDLPPWPGPAAGRRTAPARLSRGAGRTGTSCWPGSRPEARW